MSNKTQLQTNNTALDALIARVNAAKDTAASLPETGGGGGVETCTVKITCPTSDIYGYFYTKVVDGNYSMGYFTNESERSNLDVTLTDVLCGGFIAVQTNISMNFLSVAISGDATYEVICMTSSAMPIVAITTPTSPGSYSEVIIIDND